MKRAVLLGITVAFMISATVAAEASPRNELSSVMAISKSSNKNEVRYALDVDAQCAPATTAPVRTYWQMRERGPNVTEGLTSRERRILGVASQEVSPDTVRFVVNALPSRAFVVHLARNADGTCGASVDTTIAGTPARVLGIHVKQTFFGGLDYVRLTGRTADGATVEERLRL